MTFDPGLKLTRGRWKRVHVSRVPTSYLEWLAIANVDLGDEIAHAVVAELHSRHRAVLDRYNLAHLLLDLPAGFGAAAAIGPRNFETHGAGGGGPPANARSDVGVERNGGTT
jgi:hypothetical protein